MTNPVPFHHHHILHSAQSLANPEQQYKHKYRPFHDRLVREWLWALTAGISNPNTRAREPIFDEHLSDNGYPPPAS